MTTKFCINCKHIAKNGSGDETRFRCFATQNIRSKSVNLVTGAAITQFWYDSCAEARMNIDPDPMGNPVACGTDGAWFEEAPPKFHEPAVKPSAIARTANDLLSQLDNMR